MPAGVLRFVADELEAVLQEGEEFLGLLAAQPSRGEFDRERNAVEARADALHHRPGAGGQPELRVGGVGALREEPHRVGRDGHRRDGEDLLPRQAEGLPAGGEDVQRGGRGEEPRGELRAGPDEVFAGVEDEQQVLVGEVPGEHLVLGPGRVVGGAQGRGDRVHEQFGVLEFVEFDAPGAVGEPVRHVGRGTQGEAGLPDPAEAGHRHQPGARTQLSQQVEFAAASDERGVLRRQLVGHDYLVSRRSLRVRYSSIPGMRTARGSRVNRGLCDRNWPSSARISP